MHPLGYFASALDGTTDAAILSELVSHHGPYLERLSIEAKLALRAVLSYYVFYKLRYARGFTIEKAVTEAMPQYTKASILTTILTLEGISTENAEGLIKFITEQCTWSSSASAWSVK